MARIAFTDTAWRTNEPLSLSDMTEFSIDARRTLSRTNHFHNSKSVTTMLLKTHPHLKLSYPTTSTCSATPSSCFHLGISLVAILPQSPRCAGLRSFCSFTRLSVSQLRQSQRPVKERPKRQHYQSQILQRSLQAG